jgi:hypothetical protein
MAGVDVTPLKDVTAGAWLSRHLTRLGAHVRDVVPAEYEAHVLVRHHPDEDGGPPIGCLDRVSLAAICEVLPFHTATPDVCWFALWEGNPGLPRRWAPLPRMHLPERAYLMFRAPVVDVVALAMEIECLGFDGDAQGCTFIAYDGSGARRDVDPAELARYADEARATGRARSPNLLWPDDRAWVVGTDIDGDDTLVAGTQSLAYAILAHPMLDGEQVTANDRLTDRT